MLFPNITLQKKRSKTITAFFILKIVNLNLCKQIPKTCFLINNSSKICHSNSLLFHCITISDGYSIVHQTVVIDRDTKWRSDSILSSVTFPDGIFFFVEQVEIILQVIEDRFSVLCQTIFFHQWKNRCFYRRQGWR